MDLKTFLESNPKVVIRPKGGRKGLKGTLHSNCSFAKGLLQIITIEGQVIPLDLEQLKAVFFVRTYEGDRTYLETKVLTTDPEQPGIRARIRFEDNETIEGVIENTLELLHYPGFFFWPADPQANNRLIFVVKSSLLGFRVLGVKG